MILKRPHMEKVSIHVDDIAVIRRNFYEVLAVVKSIELY